MTARRVLLGITLCLTACRAPTPAEPPTPPAQAALDTMPAELSWPGPALHHSRTSNGLMVALHDPGPDAPLFSLSVVIPYGSAHDPPDLHGAAYSMSVMFAHAGVEDPASGENSEDLTARLESLGVDRHSEVYPEHLVFSMHGPAPQAATIMRVLCGLVYSPRLDGESYREGVEEILQADEERAAGNGALAQEALTHALFEGHPVGRPAVPGDNAPGLEKLLDFVRSVTSDPPHALLLAATTDAPGVLAAAEACRPGVKMVEEEPGRLVAHPSSPPEPLKPIPPLEPHPGGPLRLGLVASDEGTVYIRYGGRAPPAGTPDSAALHAALETLANGFSSSLVTQLRTRRGLVYGVEGGVLTTRSASSWYLATSTSEANAAEVVAVLESTLAELHAVGLAPADWKRMARANALGFAQGADNLEGLMATEAEHFRLGLAPNASWRTPRRWWEMDETWAARSASEWLDPERSVLVMVGSGAALVGPLRDFVDKMVDVETWPPP